LGPDGSVTGYVYGPPFLAMEYFFACPYCSERISMVLDVSVKRQTYIEDCEVCCQPIEVRYSVKDDEVRQFEAQAI